MDAANSPATATAATEPELADRLIFRMCSALIEQAGRRRAATPGGRSCGRTMAGVDDPPGQARGVVRGASCSAAKADFEQGFSLRLVQGLARIAGAELVAPQGTISLLFPRG